MNKKHTETIDSKLKMVWQSVSRMYNAEAILHDLTLPMGQFLLNIDSQEGSFACDIAPLLGMEGTSLSRLTLSLERKNLIKRVPDKSDGRKIKILLTNKGKVSKELAKNVVRDFNQLVAIKLGKEKIDTFFKTLDEINLLVEERNKINFKNKLS